MKRQRLFLYSIVWTAVMLGGGFWLALASTDGTQRHDLDAPEQATRLGQTIGTVSRYRLRRHLDSYAYTVGQDAVEESGSDPPAKAARQVEAST